MIAHAQVRLPILRTVPSVPSSKIHLASLICFRRFHSVSHLFFRSRPPASQVWSFIISWISLDFISMWFLIADVGVWVLSVKRRLHPARFLSFSFLSISLLYWTTFRWVHVATGEVS